MRDTAGYAYLYKKTVRLTKGKPQLVLEHSLKNTGTKIIESSVYEHNFYMIDGKPAGPDFTVKFPFDVRATADLKGMAETRGKEFTYLKELPKGPSVYTALEGFGNTPKDYDIRVENRRGARRRPPDFRPPLVETGLLVHPLHRLSRSLYRHAHRTRQGIHLAHRLRLLHSSRIGSQITMRLISKLLLSAAALACLLPSGFAQPAKSCQGRVHRLCRHLHAAQ